MSIRATFKNDIAVKLRDGLHALNGNRVINTKDHIKLPPETCTYYTAHLGQILRAMAENKVPNDVTDINTKLHEAIRSEFNLERTIHPDNVKNIVGRICKTVWFKQNLTRIRMEKFAKDVTFPSLAGKEIVLRGLAHDHYWRKIPKNASMLYDLFDRELPRLVAMEPRFARANSRDVGGRHYMMGGKTIRLSHNMLMKLVRLTDGIQLVFEFNENSYRAAKNGGSGYRTAQQTVTATRKRWETFLALCPQLHVESFGDHTLNLKLNIKLVQQPKVGLIALDKLDSPGVLGGTLHESTTTTVANVGAGPISVGTNGISPFPNTWPHVPTVPEGILPPPIITSTPLQDEALKRLRNIPPVTAKSPLDMIAAMRPLHEQLEDRIKASRDAHTKLTAKHAEHVAAAKKAHDDAKQLMDDIQQLELAATVLRRVDAK